MKRDKTDGNGTRTVENDSIRDEERTGTGVERRRSDREQSHPQLGSRILVTWFELTVVGITGSLLGTTVGGPVGFLIYLATSLLTVGVIFYNVNQLIKGWVQMTGELP
ncbi:hypothetical protein [Natrinema hispanicum]|uniref:Uncharacterized protein n=2 Tax=Natrinema hispanicum TaxID=392421 RepID=A0A1I0JF40_9EURY|nr:hypothetical protein [Natrinema hispanicum]SEU07882.1 hypothetical protein SAMN04488694_13819 [Natrinema hispanicum]